MRTTCLDCARKHIAQAVILGIEVMTGYPSFKWLVVGHLAEAEAELVELYPDLANEIREYRKEYEIKPCNLPLMDVIEQVTRLDEEEKAKETKAKRGRRRR